MRKVKPYPIDWRELASRITSVAMWAALVLALGSAAVTIFLFEWDWVDFVIQTALAAIVLGLVSMGLSREFWRRGR